MGQALAIFRKDVRHLWPRWIPAVALATLTGLVDSVPAALPSGAIMLHGLWMLSWLYLGASLVQQERLTGDRQFWLTRPYDWRLLLAAKALFLFAFATLPLIAVKAAVLAATGISPLRHAAMILAASLAATAVVGLISGALAAVTGSLMQFLWAFLAAAGMVALPFALGADYGDWDTLDWVRSAGMGILIAAAAIPVLLLQYRRRSTMVSRSILCAGALLGAAAPFGNAWHSAWAAAATPGPGQVSLSFDPAGRSRMTYVDALYFPGLRQEGFYLPVRVSGIGAGSAVVSKRAAVTVLGAGGEQWSSGWSPDSRLIATNPLTDARLIAAPGPAWQYINIDRGFYREVQNAPVKIRISVALLVLNGRESGMVRPAGRTGQLPREGICEAAPVSMLASNIPGVRGTQGIRNLAVACMWPRPGPERAYVRVASPVSREAAAALLTQAGGSEWPVDPSVWRRGFAVVSVRAEDPGLTVETWRAEMYLERSFEIDGVRLKDYLAPRATDPQ